MVHSNLVLADKDLALVQLMGAQMVQLEVLRYVVVRIQVVQKLVVGRVLVTALAWAFRVLASPEVAYLLKKQRS